MKVTRTIVYALTLALLISVLAAASVSAQGPVTRLIPAGGTTSIRSSAPGVDGVQQPELRPGSTAEEGAGSINRPRPGFKNGKFPKRPLDAPTVQSSAVAGTNPELGNSFDGMNHLQQRLANGGNQYSLEPPDQGLCVGNGYVVETINSVIRVWDTNGNALTGVGDLNTFFGYPAAINRATYPAPNSIGPDVIDPQCYYDPDNKRFVVDITTLYVDPNGDFNGKNSIDVAVSNTGDPTGAWTVYHVPAQNDGTDGTPNHHCTLDGTTPGPCFQDYPHIGADKYGVYITTNEYDLFGPKFNADLCLLEGTARRSPCVYQRDARREPQRRRLTRIHGLACDLARRTVCERQEWHRVLPQHNRGRWLRDGQSDGHRTPHRSVGGD
jgi:hypothetical protein